MIRRLIILLLIVGGLHAEADIKSNTKWETSVSYGFLSEKTPVSMLGVSKLLDYDKNSEFYATLGTMLFGSGVGLGYKYYFIDKSNSSIFLNVSYHFSYLGTADDGFVAHGLNVSPGYCLLQKNKTYTYRETFAGELKSKNYKKSSINIGISFIYLADKSGGLMPFINWQYIL